MKKTFSTTPFDWFNFIAQKYNSTALIQFVMRAENTLNFNTLKKAIRCCMIFDPILACRFQTNNIIPEWIETDYNVSDLCKYIKSISPQKEIDSFLKEKIDVSKECPIKIYLIEGEVECFVIAKIHHAVCDAGGALQFVKLLCKMYSELESNDDFTPRSISPQRNTNGFYKHFGINDKIASFKPEILPVMQSTWGTVFGNIDTNQTIEYQTLRFTKSDLKNFISFSNANNSSLNATITAAYHLALCNLLSIKEDTKEIQFSVNLRPYCDTENSICNLSNMYNIVLPTKYKFSELVRHTKSALDKIITPEIILQSVLACELMSTDFATMDNFYSKDWENVKQSGLCTPMISNVGRLDYDTLMFGKKKITDMYIVSPAFAGPSFMLAVSTYDNIMTLCVSYQKPSTSDKFVKDLLSNIKHLLSNI